jgi:hypothetical protein
LQRLKDPAETLPAEYQERRIALRFLRGKKFVVDNAIATMRQHHVRKRNRSILGSIFANRQPAVS